MSCSYVLILAQLLVVQLVVRPVRGSAVYTSSSDRVLGAGNRLPLRELSRSPLCEGLVQIYGYPCEEHEVTTDDGFILTLQRIPYGLKGADSGHGDGDMSKDRRRPPLLMQHGLFSGGESWLLSPPDENLAFRLVEQGYEVWIANGRTSRWSHGHAKWRPEDKEYWDWSWDEMALYDVPAMLRHIYTVRNGSKVTYLGHSQGTIMGLAAFSLRKITHMVEAAILLCPIAYLDHVSSAFVRVAASVYIDKLLMSAGLHEFNLRSEVGAELVGRVCDHKGVDCSDLLAAITGPNCCLNRTRTWFELHWSSEATSVRNLAHLSQMIRSGTFCRYNFGWFSNVRHYGYFYPPIYPLSNVPISLPMMLLFGGADSLADPYDVAHLMISLPQIPRLVYLSRYAHMDFIVGINGAEDFFDQIFDFLNHVQNGSYTAPTELPAEIAQLLGDRRLQNTISSRRSQQRTLLIQNG
ncbi:hypothetical protein CBR_g20059 [Chara braunii]|uniref:Partial AB-hydrolase lipase domain-containing protein n=1 Tax=Chara braunii TaxID=69332 RepID=A0A388KZF2_CHABU|nr:hypothetical protein CBR_g20059 [Chara braunii]|eukprot:GBG75429.1 hypothetical protein CBR_g20059 [Chara braunii]